MLSSTDPVQGSQTRFETFASELRSIGASAVAVLQQYSERRLVAGSAAALSEPTSVSFAGGEWSVEPELARECDGTTLRTGVRLRQGNAAQVAMGAELSLSDWSRDHYVLMPAAVYAGNRFKALGSYKSELLGDLGPTPEIYTTAQVPRLNIADGESRLQMLSGDMSFPAIAVHFPKLRRGLIITTEAATSLGYTSIALFENDDRTAATIRILAPGVRQDGRHAGKLCTDRAADWAAGDVAELKLSVYVFDAPNIQSLYDRMFDVRNEMHLPKRSHHEIPFSEAWRIQEQKFNEQNWVEKYGYYSVGMREVRSQDWQTGWVGGPNILPALLGEGQPITFARATRTFDFLANGALTASGFLRSSFHEGVWSDAHRVLLRYSADSMYCLLRSFQLLRDRSEPIHEPWQRMTRSLADGFVRLWNRYHQFGHYASAWRDELRVGGTCTAALAIGGLARAAAWFDEPAYLETAIAAGNYYHDEFVARGITNGGPGDIIQSPDSESCFGLLDSFVTLFEATRDPRWLTAARNVAHQAATWVVNYDFPFPANSTFGRMGMLTDGTVYANVQNKHSAPGICTLSGDALLKLFRATGERSYLDLLRSIAHAIPQYMSRVDRPIIDRRPNQRWPILPAGWINERVNMSDWEVRGDPDNEIGVGEIFGGSTWSEGSMLLTWAELPGIYAQPDTRLLSVLDHVNAEWSGPGEITISNPTKFDATVKVLVETSESAAQKRLDDVMRTVVRRVDVPAGGVVRWRENL